MENEADTPDYSKNEMLSGLVSQISAYIEQYHGGQVELIDFDGNIATVKLGGACIGCPLSEATLKGWVEGTIHQFFPDITVVESKESA